MPAFFEPALFLRSTRLLVQELLVPRLSGRVALVKLALGWELRSTEVPHMCEHTTCTPRRDCALVPALRSCAMRCAVSCNTAIAAPLPFCCLHRTAAPRLGRTSSPLHTTASSRSIVVTAHASTPSSSPLPTTWPSPAQALQALETACIVACLFTTAALFLHQQHHEQLIVEASARSQRAASASERQADASTSDSRQTTTSIATDPVPVYIPASGLHAWSGCATLQAGLLLSGLICGRLSAWMDRRQARATLDLRDCTCLPGIPLD